MPGLDVMNGWTEVGLVGFLVVTLAMMWIGFFLGRNK